MTNRLTASLVWLGLLGCSSQVPLDKSPCPCPESLGYICCGTGSTATCIRAGETCDTGPVVDSGADGFDAGPTDAPPALSPINGIAIGHAHACAVRQDYSVSCIGDNSKGQATPPPGQFYGVVAGGDVTCGSKIDKSDVTKNGMSVCWGDNTYGQASPPDGVMYVNAIGARHACGRDRDGNVICWGDNSLGQATPPPGDYSDLAAGRNHTCGVRRDSSNDPNVTTGTIVCWGDNSLGQATAPAIKVYLNGLHFLSAGGDHTCATDQGNQVWCWGDHSGGQSTPPIGSFVSLAVGPGHACASTFGDYKVMCWGDDWGDSTAVPPSGAYANLFAGDYRTCAWANDQSGRPILCWGATYEPWY